MNTRIEFPTQLRNEVFSPAPVASLPEASRDSTALLRLISPCLRRAAIAESSMAVVVFGYVATRFQIGQEVENLAFGERVKQSDGHRG